MLGWGIGGHNGTRDLLSFHYRMRIAGEDMTTVMRRFGDMRKDSENRLTVATTVDLIGCESVRQFTFSSAVLPGRHFAGGPQDVLLTPQDKGQDKCQDKCQDG